MSFPQTKTLSCRSSKGGFTLVEILVVIAIIALLAGVALPAVTGAIKKAKENAAMQTSHGLGLAEFQYATDNNGVFPGALPSATPAVAIGGSTDIFTLMVPTYIQNTDALWISGAGGAKYSGVGGLQKTNVSWDATVHTSDQTGLTTNDPDQTPAIMSTGSTIATFGTVGTPAAAKATITGADVAANPFGTDGVAVVYKDLSSAFETSSNNGGTATTGFNVTSTSFEPIVAVTQEKPN